MEIKRKLTIFIHIPQLYAMYPTSLNLTFHVSFYLSSVNILFQLSLFLSLSLSLPLPLSLSLPPKLSLQPTNCDSLEYLYGKIWQLFNVPYNAKP